MMSKFKRKIFKKVSPFIGGILDTLFLTNFSRRGLDYYHNYHQNDYTFNKDVVCLIHVPRTGGGTLRAYMSENKKYHTLNFGAQHYPVSLLCDPKDFKYITIFRDPIDRTISHYNMLLEMKTKVASFGFSNWLMNDKFSRNLYCQYFSGYVNSNVDQQIYNLALENLKKFYFVIDFNKFDTEAEELFKLLNLNFDKIKNHGYRIVNKSDEDSHKLKTLCEKYNYWDIKLYKEFLNLKSK